MLQADIVLHSPEEKVLEAFDFEGKDMDDITEEIFEFFGEEWDEYSHSLTNLVGFSDSWNATPSRRYLDDIAAAVALMTKHDLPAEVACDIVVDQGADYAVSWHEDNFLGTETGNMGDIAQQWFEDCGDVPNHHLAQYIDWERVERDLFLGGDWTYYEDRGERYVYSSH